MNEIEFELKNCQQLIGGKIIEIARSAPDEFNGLEFPALVIELPNGSKKIAWIQADHEGNAPGSLSIEDLPT